MRCLKDLTGGRFEDGALDRRSGTDLRGARRRLRGKGAAKDQPRDLLSAEYAFLTDLQRGQAGPDWRSERERKAERVLATLDGIAAERCHKLSEFDG